MWPAAEDALPLSPLRSPEAWLLDSAPQCSRLLDLLCVQASPCLHEALLLPCPPPRAFSGSRLLCLGSGQGGVEVCGQEASPFPAHLLRHRLMMLLTMLLVKYCLAICGWEAIRFLTV